MQATAAGGDRQELHERIRRHALAASRRMKEDGEAPDLVDRIASDPAFGLTREAMQALLDPHRFVGRAPEQVARFLDEEVAPVLEHRGAAARERLGEPDVRV